MSRQSVRNATLAPEIVPPAAGVPGDRRQAPLRPSTQLPPEREAAGRAPVPHADSRLMHRLLVWEDLLTP